MSFAIHVGPNLRTSPFHAATLREGVTVFSVYNHMLIPGSFGDPEAEYRRLTDGVAMWDVAAQRQVQIEGPEAADLAQYLTPRSLAGLRPGRGRYVPLCDHDGHVINDPVLLKFSDEHFWLSIADSDILLWAGAIARERGLAVRVSEPDVSPLAIQGPKAGAVARALFGAWVDDLGFFAFREADLDGIPLVVARSGWSKQGGYELYLRDGARGDDLWHRVREAGAPHGIGPGAPNDAERIEGGLASYGADFRHTTHPANPFELGMERQVDLAAGHDFIGRAALERIAQEGPARRRTGVFIAGAAMAPNAQPLELHWNGIPAGHVSETVYSPRLQRMIGIGLVRSDLPEGAEVRVMTAEGARGAELTALPFIG